MDITTQQSGDTLEVKVRGRLDAYWADHLSAALDEAVRGGAHRLRLEMADVSYLSSVGIRVLLKFYKQLQRIKGSFAVANPSEPVKTVLELAGLEVLLASEVAPAGAAPVSRAAVRRFERPGAAFEVYDIAPETSLTCRAVGQPELLQGCRFGAEDCRQIRFPGATFGLGLGAFGNDFQECRGRFGEFLAAGGAAAYLPTDGSNVPDYLVASGALVPELRVLYALACEGRFARMVRFDSTSDHGPVTLAEIVDACLEIVDADVAGMVVMAESAGLVGAALRRSPALDVASSAPFAHPEIRAWLSFTPERAYLRSLALAVGVAARGECQPLRPLLRPIAGGVPPSGHFHAAAFSYRPIQKGPIDLQASVASLFETETLQGILHLLTDDREITGAGQSELTRGACWIGPIAEIITER
jgi:anti-anti-sigma factor